MSKLLSNINSAGKQKVYLCCHPEDQDMYYDSIRADLIRANDNIAIFRESDPYSDYNEAELFSMLDSMNLFVVIVTGRFLTERSRAYSADLDFAVKNHIPVLPIAVESGITDIFNASSLLGGLQYIDKTSNDSTEISYFEKLKRYLDTVLVSDKLAKRIRSEFAAILFLSYRKKDREIALDLMKRIRLHDFCRDVAIWYDEYLVPGESFEDNIKDRLIASDVVVMNVTPNLLENGNFIYTEEYPCANSELRKPIVAAEMQRTNHFRLRSMYPGIKNKLVNGTNNAALGAALRNALTVMAGKKDIIHPDNSPEHLFYMGLAYKNRIDIEADPAKAVELLTASFNQNYYRSGLEIARMYRNGDRLQRSSDEAIVWYDRYIAALEASGDKSYETRNDLLNAYVEKAEILQSLGRLNDTAEAYTRSLKLCRDMCEEYNGFLEYVRLIGLYNRLSELCSMSGDENGAAEYLRGQLDACQWFEDHLDDMIFPASVTYDSVEANIYYNMMFACQRLGDMANGKGDLIEARRHYINQIHACQDLAGTQTGKRIESESDNMLSIAYDRLGDICRLQGDIAGAGNYYQKSFDIREKLAANHDRDEFRRNLSMSHTRLAYVSKMCGDDDDAKHHYYRALEISRQLAENNSNAQYQDDLALAYYNYGLLTDDISCYRRARDIWQDLSEKTGIGRYRERYAMVCSTISLAEPAPAGPAKTADTPEEYEQLGDASVREGDPAKAKQFYDKAFLSHAQQGELAERNGKTEDAAKHYTALVSICRKSLDAYESDATRHNIAIGCERLGNIAAKSGSNEAARDYYLELVRVLEPVADTTKITDNRRELAVGYQRLSEVYESLGNYQDAKSHILKAIKVFESYPDLSDAAGFRSDHSQCYRLLSGICLRHGEKSEAFNYMITAQAIEKGK